MKYLDGWGAMWRAICPLRDRKCDYYLLRAKYVSTGCKRVKMALTHARTAWRVLAAVFRSHQTEIGRVSRHKTTSKVVMRVLSPPS